jgi:hypothetical protein
MEDGPNLTDLASPPTNTFFEIHLRTSKRADET